MPDFLNRWHPTHVIHVESEFDRYVMRYDDEEGTSFYTRDEYDAAAPAYWTLDRDGNLVGQGLVIHGSSYESLRPTPPPFLPGPYAVSEYAPDSTKLAIYGDGAHVYDVALVPKYIGPHADGMTQARLFAQSPRLHEIVTELVLWEQDPDAYAGDLADLASAARLVLALINPS